MNKQKPAESGASELDFLPPTEVVKRRSEEIVVADSQSTYQVPTPKSYENQIIWLHPKTLFARARWDGIWTSGRTRPISPKKFSDDRLLLAYSTLRPDATGDDGRYLRRVFYLTPRDLREISATWPDAEQMSESENQLKAIFDRHLASVPKRRKLA